MRFRFRPLAPIAPKVSPDPAAAAELARRRSLISFVPSNGFLVEPPPGPRFDPAPVVEDTSEIVCITDEAVIAELLASDAPLVIPLCTTAGDGEPVQAPAQEDKQQVDRDWSQFDAPAWERLGRANPMRVSIGLLLPAFLRRQAD